MTSERLLLLNGKLDQNFCSVVWESMLELIVHVEVTSRSRLATEFDIVVIWYLSSGVRYTKSIPSDTKLGTDSLLSKSFFVPQGAGFSFMDILNGKIKNQLDNMCWFSRMRRDVDNNLLFEGSRRNKVNLIPCAGLVEHDRRWTTRISNPEACAEYRRIDWISRDASMEQFSIFLTTGSIPHLSPVLARRMNLRFKGSSWVWGSRLISLTGFVSSEFRRLVLYPVDVERRSLWSDAASRVLL